MMCFILGTTFIVILTINFQLPLSLIGLLLRKNLYIVLLFCYIMINSDLQLGNSTKYVVQSHARPESPLMRPLNRLLRQLRELIH